MKLRLPHKFQAALMAALASVSFTTLSTGTLAVATGAVLLAGQQAWAQVTSIHPMQQVVVAGETYTSTAENGVLVTEGNDGDREAINLSGYSTADYLVLTSTSNGRYKVNDASNLANFGTVVLAAGSYQGESGTVNFSGGQIFVNGGASVSNDLILGTSGYSESGGWAGAIRMGGNNTLFGKVDIVQDTTLVMGGSATFTGNVSGAKKTLTLNKTSTLTFSGGLTLGTLKNTEAGTVVVIGSADNKSTIGNLTSVSGSTLNITNTNLGISGDQTFQSNLEIGAGSTVTVGKTDSLKYSGITNTITLREGGVLDLGGYRWTVGSGTTFVMDGGEIKGAGDQHGALDYHEDGATIRATADSTISAKIRLRATTTKFDVNAGTTLTLSGTVRDNGHLRKLGSGTLVLSGNAEYSGSTFLDAGTIKVAQGGTLTEGVFTSAAGTTFVNEGTATIGKDGANSSLAATVANTGALTLKGTINVPTTDISAYEVAEAGETTYSGTGAYEGNGYLSKDTTKYYLVQSTGNGTLTNNATITGVDSSELKDGNSLVFTYTAADNGIYHVNGNLAYNADQMSGATQILVSRGGTLSIGGNDAASLLNSKITGSGTVVINADTSITTGTQASPYTTLATGTLRVAAGKKLILGDNISNDYLNFSSFSAVELENEAAIYMKQFPGLVFNNVSVASGASAYIGKSDQDTDTKNKDIDAATLRGTTLVNGTLTMGTKWKWQMSIDKLKGSGTLVAAGANETHRLIINGFDGTFGTLKYMGGSTEIVLNGSGTITNLDNTGSGNTLKLAAGVVLDVTNTAKVNTLDGAGTIVVDVTKTWSLGAANTWTGTLRLHGNKNDSIGNFVGNASSTVELTDLNGWTSNWNGTITQNIKLTNGTTGYAWQNGAYGGSANQPTPTATFTGTWSGDGMFKVVSAQDNRSMNYTYTGNVSQWTGEFNKGGLQTTILTFSQNANVVNAVISKAAGAATFTVAAATDVTFNKAVTADAFNLSDGKTATFNAAAKLGNATATGGAILQGQNGSLELAGLAKSGDGALTLNGFSKLESTITLSGGSLVFGAGEYDLSDLDSVHSEEYSDTDHGYLTVTDTVQLVDKTDGSFSVDGATFKFTTQEGPATATTVNEQGYVEMTYRDDTTYILNNGTSMEYVEEYGANPNLATVRVQGGTGTINIDENWFLQHLDVRDGSTAVIASENATELMLSDAASFGSNAYVEVQDGAYLQLLHAGTAAAVLTHAKGAGTITLADNASLGAGSATAATGTLTIAAGKTLSLGGGESTKVNISSFTQVVLDGGTISYNADESTINGLTVKDEKNGTLHLEDMGSKALVLGGVTAVEGTLTVKNHWNSLLTISHLTGDGTLIQTNGDNAVQEMIFAINSLEGFTGAIELSHNQQGDTTSINTGSSDVHFRALTMNIGSHTMDFALDADTIIDALTLTAGTAHFTGAGTLTVGGLDGTASLNVASLVINGTDAAHSYNGTASIGTLTMNGGTQTIGGTVTPTNTWVLNGGSLSLAGAYNLDSMDASSRVAGHTGGVIDGNGFEALTGIQVVQVNNEAQLTSTATFTYGGKSDYTMDAQGVVKVESSGTTYDTFYILNNEDDKMETLTNAREQAGEHVGEFVNIVMNGGTSLDANAGGTLTALTVSGGTAGATTLVTDTSETSANLAITTVTVGVGDNLTVEGKALTITSTVLNERAGMVVGDDASVTLSGVDMGLNSTFTVTGTGRVKLTDGATAKNLLLNATGDGTYELAANVNLGNNVSTQPTGTLVVDNGYTLTLSGNKGQETYLDSFGKIQLEGGNIASSASMGTLHNVTVTADSAIKFNDFKDLSGGQHQSLTTFAGTTDIAQNATLTVHTAYKSNLKYEGLSGAGTLKFTTNAGDYGGATVAIDSLQGFSGNITLAPGNNNPVKITAAIGDAPVSMGVITLANGGNITATTGSNTLTVAGLDGAAGSLTAENLTINVEGEGSHTYGGTLTVNGQLTKTASGTQSLGSFAPAASIVVSGGTLNFTGNVEIQQLAYTEGPAICYTDATQTLLDQANGFRYEESKRAVYIPTGDGRVTLGENGAFTLGGQTVTVGEDGVYHSSVETADLTTLWVNTGTVNLADYASVAGLTTAKLADAGTLNLGTAAAPGTIGTLQYQENATVLHLAGTGTVNAIAGDANLNLAEGAEITLGYNPAITSGHTFTTAGAGTLVVSTLNVTGGTAHLGSNARLERFVLSQAGKNASTLEIGAGATVEVTGTATDSDSGVGSFMVSNWETGNVLNIEGTLIANSGISTRDGQADINVKDGGTLEMRAGIFKNTDRTKSININVKQRGTLIAAGHDGDYTTYGMRVNLEDGSTLAGYYAANVNDIAINQTLTASGALTIDSGDTGKTMTINTGLTGEGTSITKVGEGTLVFSGANTYGGATTVNAGTLKTGYLGNGGTTVNGSTLELTSAVSTTGALTLGNNSTLVFAGADMLTAGSLALGQDVANLTFNLNSIVPTTAGTITLATGTTAASLENVNVEVVWTTLPTQYFEHGEVELNEAGTAWVITLFSKGQDLIWNGGVGTWSSSDAMWHTGTTEGLAFNSGDKATFAASATPAVATLAEAVNAEKVTVESGATVSLQPGEGEVSLTTAEIVVGGALTTSVDVNATAVVASGTNGSWTVAGGTAAATDITAAAGNALAIAVNSGTLTAETITANGTVSVAGSVNAGNVTGNGTVSTAGTLSAGKVTIETGESLTLGGAGTVNVGSDRNAATLNGAGTLVIDNATVTVTGTNLNSFTGNIEVMSGGTLKLGESSTTWTDTSSLGAYNKGDSTRTITIHEGGVLDMNGYADSCYVYTLDGGRFTNTGTGRGTGSTQTAGLILTANSYVGDTEHSNEFWLMDRGYAATKLVLGENNLTKQGGSVFGLYNTAVTGSGYLVVEGGTLKFNDSNSSSYGANFRLAGGNVSDGKVNLSANTIIDATEDGSFSSVITGNGKSVTKTGEGTLTLTKANTYSGGTAINAGKVVTTNATALGSGNVDIAATAALEMQSDLTIAGVLSGTGSITYNKATDGTLTLSKDKTDQTLGMNISATDTGKLNLALNGNSDYYFSGNVSVNNITQSASVTLFVAGSGSVTTTGHASTGRLVVGNDTSDSAAVFTLSGENARLSNGNDHTYGAKVQGYGTFAVVGGATETLTGDLINGPGPGFHGTFAADGAGSVLTLNSDLASDVTFKATNGGEIVLAKAYTMGDNTAVDGGTVKVSNGLTVNGTVDLSKGTLTQTGGTVSVNEGKSLTLGNASITSAISNSGTVNFTQDITATGLAKEGDDVSYFVGADDAKTAGENHFDGQRTESSIRVVTGGTVNPGGHKVTQDSVAYTLNANGTATGVTADDVDYTMFLQYEKDSVVQSSSITSTAAGHGEIEVSVSVDSAKLIVDSAVFGVGCADADIVIDNGGEVYSVTVIAGDNTYTGALNSLTEFTLFAKGGDSTLKLQNAQSTTAPYIANAGAVDFYGSQVSGSNVKIDAAVSESGSLDTELYALDNARYTVEADTMVKRQSGNVTVNNHLKVNTVSTEMPATGSLTLANGADSSDLRFVTAVNGDIEFRNMKAANNAGSDAQTKVGLQGMYIFANKTVSFYEAADPTVDTSVAEVTIANGGVLQAQVGAKLEADLVMKAGSTMDVHRAQETYGLELGCSLTIEPGAQLSQADLTAISGLTMENRWYFLDTSVEQLIITDIGKWDAKAGESLTFTDYSQFDLDASRVYTQLDSQRYAMVYNWAPAGTNVGTYTLAIYLIPEPTTSTLSLLALCALAARRRRK